MHSLLQKCQIIRHVHITNTVITTEERFINFIEMKEKFRYYLA